MEPLLAAAVASQSQGSGVHYFVRDICVKLVKWEHARVLGRRPVRRLPGRCSE